MHPASLTLLDQATWCWGAGQAPPRVLAASTTPLAFHRQFVAGNRPAVVTGLTDGWRKLPASWEGVVRDAMGGRERVVHCNATPTGRGDAVVSNPDNSPSLVFCKPWVHEDTTLGELEAFLTHQASHKHRGILYLSQQDNSLLSTFPDFCAKGYAQASIPFADEVFGKLPDAVNLWLGDERSTSVVHRDSSYENFYCVLRGEKVFHLLPPCAAPFLQEREYPNAQYRWHSGGEFHIDVDPAATTTPWIEIDIADPVAMASREPFSHVAKLVTQVHVRPGECLYLPAGWFHRVTQTCPTLAVNFWYDREFNALWAVQAAFEDATAAPPGVQI